MHLFRDQNKIREFISDLLTKKESEDLEFKHASGGFPGNFWDTYSSFANTEGGTIIFGVEEKDGQLYLDALSDEKVEKYKKEFWSNVNNKATVNRCLLKNDDVEVVEYNGNNIMLFHIPCATREERPVFRTNNPYSGTFKRNHEGDYKCTEKEVQRMFADANVSNPADSRILQNYTFDDLDAESLQQYRQLFATARPNHPWLGLNDQRLLEKLGGYRKDRETGEEGFTLAGLLMFGKYDSITDNACAPDFFPDYQEWMDNDPNGRWTARIYPDGTWEANLFQYYRRVLPRLQNFLPVPFRLDGNQRRDETTAHVAVREAFINLCVHADFSVNASLIVKHVKNEFIFSNPGTLLITKAQYYDGGQSVCRNKALQKMFMMLGAAEKAGSGVDKILKGWNDSNWRTPYIETTLRPDTVNLYLPMLTLLDEEIKQGLIKIFGSNILNVEHNYLSTLSLAYSEGYVSNERLRYVLNLHRADITLLLKEMSVKGYLVSEGYGRGTKYHLPHVVQASNIDSNVGSNLESKPHKNRLSKKELFDFIVDACEEWIALDDIARTVERKPDYLLNEIIPLMLKEGLIERLYPENPRNPYQKYKRKE